MKFLKSVFQLTVDMNLKNNLCFLIINYWLDKGEKKLRKKVQNGEILMRVFSSINCSLYLYTVFYVLRKIKILCL